MISITKNIFSLNNLLNNYNYKLFLIGIFLLPSAPAIASLILIFPLVNGLVKDKERILKDKYNYPLFLAALVMILKSLFNIYFPAFEDGSWDRINNLISLTNWIPLFLCYFGFQNYLKTNAQRLTLANALIASSIPVIISGLSQFFLKIYGPFELLNGLIIWYQRPINISDGLTGLFSNPNYAGAWFILIWPFCLSSLIINKYKSNFNWRTLTIFIICALFVICIVLTNSRGAWLNFILALPIVIGREVLYWMVPLLSILLFIIFLSFLPFVPIEIQSFAQLIIPQKIWFKFSEILLNFDSYPRIDIWERSIQFISQKPFFGWGTGVFPVLYFSETGFFNNHTHNLFLELSLNYGLIVSILVFSPIITLLINLYIKIYRKKSYKTNSNDRVWWGAAFLFFMIHMFDIPYYDLRISILGWVFLASIRNILLSDCRPE